MSVHLGLDVGGTNVKYAVIECAKGDPRIVTTGQAPTASEEGPAAVLERLVRLGREVASANGEPDTVAVAWPGLFDPESGTAVLFPNLHGDWTGRPLAEPLRAGFGRSVPLINDGHAFALAEARLGAGRGCRDVLCLALGTGIGGGLVVGGRLHLGVADRAGEVGHHTVVTNGPVCGCGNRGCLELFAGARAIAGAAGKSSFDAVVEAARAGEKESVAALARAATVIGVAVANLLIFLAPERVVVGGGVAAAGPLVLEPLWREVSRRARVAPLDQIEIARAGLGPYGGAVGAALYGRGGVAG